MGRPSPRVLQPRSAGRAATLLRLWCSSSRRASYVAAGRCYSCYASTAWCSWQEPPASSLPPAASAGRPTAGPRTCGQSVSILLADRARRVEELGRPAPDHAVCVHGCVLGLNPHLQLAVEVLSQTWLSPASSCFSSPASAARLGVSGIPQCHLFSGTQVSHRYPYSLGRWVQGSLIVP
jgi:hypothetical protein